MLTGEAMARVSKRLEARINEQILFDAGTCQEALARADAGAGRG
ncbi:MAG: hypothetical protein AB1714_16995 [Acidobacteriota bacterium]